MTTIDFLFVIVVLLITKQEKRLSVGAFLVAFIVLSNWNELVGFGFLAACILFRVLLAIPSGKTEHPIGSF